MVSENAFQQAVIDLARWAGWSCYHTLRSTGSTAGYPDLTLVRGDVLLFAELKSQHGRVTPAQATWLAALREVTHVESTVWRPGDWDVIERRLLQGELVAGCSRIAVRDRHGT
jgi:hypothetical protein